MDEIKLCYVTVTQEIYLKYLKDEEGWIDEWQKTFVVATVDVDKAREIVLNELDDIKDSSFERRTIDVCVKTFHKGDIISKKETYYN